MSQKHTGKHHQGPGHHLPHKAGKDKMAHGSHHDGHGEHDMGFGPIFSPKKDSDDHGCPVTEDNKAHED